MLGGTVLYFGCYHQDQDFLYRDELAKEIDRGNLQLVTAFSHAQEERYPKIGTPTLRAICMLTYFSRMSFIHAGCSCSISCCKTRTGFGT